MQFSEQIQKANKSETKPLRQDDKAKIDKPKQISQSAVVSKGENEWSGHQRLFEENIRKTKKEVCKFWK